MSKENKTSRLNVRFTPSELEQIKHRAQERGLSISEYLCFCALHQQNSAMQQELQEFQRQQETLLQGWKQDLEEKASTQIQEVRLEQETKFKKLEQKVKICQIGIITLAIFLTITIVFIIFLLLDKSQESQAQAQDNSLHLQEKATQRPSHQSQQKGQIKIEQRLLNQKLQNNTQPQQQGQVKSHQSNLQLQEPVQVEQRPFNLQLRHDTPIQKPQMQDNAQLHPKEDISKELMEIGRELQEQEREKTHQSTQPPEEDKSKTLPLQTSPDTPQDWDHVPSTP
ncbi:hypothetical protein ACFOPX_08445 [Helicobacter baculiformis]|uniref:Uncharacterized protein n=2 Tax=Helicobacter baculiformis TaxID=427351 RepID=A0ABV7ZIX8_9HELI